MPQGEQMKTRCLYPYIWHSLAGIPRIFGSSFTFYRLADLHLLALCFFGLSVLKSRLKCEHCWLKFVILGLLSRQLFFRCQYQFEILLSDYEYLKFLVGFMYTYSITELKTSLIRKDGSSPISNDCITSIYVVSSHVNQPSYLLTTIWIIIYMQHLHFSPTHGDHFLLLLPYLGSCISKCEPLSVAESYPRQAIGSVGSNS